MTFDMTAFTDQYASVEDMGQWAESVINSRQPDFRIGQDTPGGFDCYMERWYILPRNPRTNVYLHRILRSDDDRALHDHPWHNTSLVLLGGYREHTPDGVFERQPGDIVHRAPTDRHRLEIDEPAVSLFLTGAKVRDWGFWCDGGDRFVPWQEFCDPADRGGVGRGCGEP